MEFELAMETDKAAAVHRGRADVHRGRAAGVQRGRAAGVRRVGAPRRGIMIEVRA